MKKRFPASSRSRFPRLLIYRRKKLATSALQNIENVTVDDILSDARRNLSSANDRRLKRGYFHLCAFRRAEGLEVLPDPILIVFPIGILAGLLRFLFGFFASRSEEHTS